MRIRFDKIEGIIRIYDGTRYLTLFCTKEYDAIYDRTRYLISLKSNITYIFSHYFAKFKVDSYGSLPIEKTLTVIVLTLKVLIYFVNMKYYKKYYIKIILTLHVIIHIKSVLNKDKNHYYYQLSKK